jgi:hypothetical protein
VTETESKKKANDRDKVRGWINPPGSSTTTALPDFMLDAIHEAVRTGLRTIDPDDPDEMMPLYCSAEYHFARFTGPGSSLAVLLYNLSLRLSKESGYFQASMQDIARYLNVIEDKYIYAAVRLLVASGFWQVVEAERGKAAKYHPVHHTEWSQRHPGFCCVKYEFPHKDQTELAQLGAILHGILGEKFFTNVLKGWLKLAGHPDAVVKHAKEFMLQDAGHGAGKERRKRFSQYLRDQCE